MEENEQIKDVTAKKAQTVLKFLTNSKYVIFVITSFTVCWMPSILLVFSDDGYHRFGGILDSQKNHCGYFAAQNLTLRDQNIGKNCIEDLVIGTVTHCDVPGDNLGLCVAVHDHLHDFMIVCITRLCMSMAVLGSFINPFIHGLWYPGFRQAVIHLKNR